MRSFILILFFAPLLFVSGESRSQDNKRMFSNPLLPLYLKDQAMIYCNDGIDEAV